jgi:hypothetical protein
MHALKSSAKELSTENALLFKSQPNYSMAEEILQENLLSPNQPRNENLVVRETYNGSSTP